MILPIEVENNIIDFDVEIKKENENCYDETCKDVVYVYWNKKNIFGKTKRETSLFGFERKMEYQHGSRVWIRSNMCQSFLDRIKNLNKKDGVLKRLKEEFTGNDEFSLGVQHAVAAIEGEKNGTN